MELMIVLQNITPRADVFARLFPTGSPGIVGARHCRALRPILLTQGTACRAPTDTEARPKRKKPIPYAAVCFILLSAFLSLIGCRGNGSAGATSTNSKNAPAGKQVRFIRASDGMLARTIGVSGTLAAEEDVTLSLKVSGRVRDIHVDLGSSVTKGQELASLEPIDFDLRVRQAEAALQQARARLGLPIEGEQDAVEAVDTGVVRQAGAVKEQARLTQQRMQSLWEQGLVPRSIQIF